MTFLSSETIGKIIAARRIDQEMSQAQLAILVEHHFPTANCSQAMLSRIENGQQEPSLTQLGAIASVLDMPASTFIKAEDPRAGNISPRTYSAPGRYNLE